MVSWAPVSKQASTRNPDHSASVNEQGAKIFKVFPVFTLCFLHLHGGVHFSKYYNSINNCDNLKRCEHSSLTCVVSVFKLGATWASSACGADSPGFRQKVVKVIIPGKTVLRQFPPAYRISHEIRYVTHADTCNKWSGISINNNIYI